MLEKIILPTPNDPPMLLREASQQGGMPIKKLSIIIPAYNEENTIGAILDKVNYVKLLGNV